jgi:hypothetical protein
VSQSPLPPCSDVSASPTPSELDGFARRDAASVACGDLEPVTPVTSVHDSSEEEEETLPVPKISACALRYVRRRGHMAALFILFTGSGSGAERGIGPPNIIKLTASLGEPLLRLTTTSKASRRQCRAESLAKGLMQTAADARRAWWAARSAAGSPCRPPSAYATPLYRLLSGSLSAAEHRSALNSLILEVKQLCLAGASLQSINHEPR